MHTHNACPIVEYLCCVYFLCLCVCPSACPAAWHFVAVWRPSLSKAHPGLCGGLPAPCLPAARCCSRAELNLSALSLWWRAWVVPPPPACLCVPIAAALCVSRVPFCDLVAPCHNHFAVVFLWASPCVWCLSPHHNRLPTAILPQCAGPVLCVLCAGPTTASLSCFCDCCNCVLYARASFAASMMAVCPPLRVLVCGGAHLNRPGAVCGVVKMVVLPLLSAAERLHMHRLASALHAS